MMNLTVQFFAVYLLIWVLWTLRQCRIRALEGFLDVALPTMEAARRTVQFCPMLAVMSPRAGQFAQKAYSARAPSNIRQPLHM